MISIFELLGKQVKEVETEGLTYLAFPPPFDQELGVYTKEDWGNYTLLFGRGQKKYFDMMPNLSDRMLYFSTDRRTLAKFNQIAEKFGLGEILKNFHGTSLQLEIKPDKSFIDSEDRKSSSGPQEENQSNHESTDQSILANVKKFTHLFSKTKREELNFHLKLEDIEFILIGIIGGPGIFSDKILFQMLGDLASCTKKFGLKGKFNVLSIDAAYIKYKTCYVVFQDKALKVEDGVGNFEIYSSEGEFFGLAGQNNGIVQCDLNDLVYGNIIEGVRLEDLNLPTGNYSEHIEFWIPLNEVQTIKTQGGFKDIRELEECMGDPDELDLHTHSEYLTIKGNQSALVSMSRRAKVSLVLDKLPPVERTDLYEISDDEDIQFDPIDFSTLDGVGLRKLKISGYLNAVEKVEEVEGLTNFIKCQPHLWNLEVVIKKTDEHGDFDSYLENFFQAVREAKSLLMVNIDVDEEVSEEVMNKVKKFIQGAIDKEYRIKIKHKEYLDRYQLVKEGKSNFDDEL